MALRSDHSDAMAAQRKTYDFCIRCFRQCGLENVRKWFKKNEYNLLYDRCRRRQSMHARKVF